VKPSSASARVACPFWHREIAQAAPCGPRGTRSTS
jgi:hypothetical protein